MSDTGHAVRAACAALWGEDARPVLLARALGVGDRTAARWMTGRNVAPVGILAELLAMVDARSTMIDEAAEALESCIAAVGGAPSGDTVDVDDGDAAF